MARKINLNENDLYLYYEMCRGESSIWLAQSFIGHGKGNRQPNPIRPLSMARSS